MRKTYKGTTAEHAVTRLGAVMVVETVGIFTQNTVEELRNIIRVELMAAEAVKVLCDMRRAAVLIDDDGWKQVLEASVYSTPLSAPIGILADAVSFEPLFRHCWEMVRHGRTRYVFSSLQGAEAWAGMELPLPEMRDFQPVSEPGELG